jgi:HD-GYP domain-containing protein (c-di-GMP phosphodiesterase class II)
MKKLFPTMFVIVFIMSVLPFLISATAITNTIVVIHSYAEDYQHTRDIREGINEAFEGEINGTMIRHEYLDTKNYLDDAYLERMKNIYMDKYKDVNVSAVIASDNNALYFLDQFKDDIFPNTNVFVATGITLTRDLIDQYDEITLIEEEPDYKKNIDLIMEIYPNLEKIHILVDDTATGYQVKQSLIDELEDYPDINYTFVEPDSLDDLLNYVDQLELQKDAFIWTVFFRDFSGESYYTYEVMDVLKETSPVPIFGFWEFYLDHGLTGGYLMSSKVFGEKAIEFVIDGLGGGGVKIVEIDETFFEYKFDDLYLKKYGIIQLPYDSVRINTGLEFIAENKILFMIFASVIVLLSAIISILIYMIKSRNLVEKKDIEIIEINNVLISTQKEIIQRLGDVIETSSNETGQHVERMAKLSRFVAERLGLSEDDCTVLEMIAPMHDVGKIGISDEILHKPGRLTEKEFEIVKNHTIIGYDLFKHSENKLLTQAAELSLYHHERYDGSGYPHGLIGEEIPIFSQIVGLCDVYDALRSVRSYKKAWPVEEVKQYFIELRGIEFRKDLVDILILNIDEIEAIRE